MATTTSGLVTVTTDNVRRAKLELSRMQSSLRKWLKYRLLVDQVLAGTAKVGKPLAYAQAVASQAQADRSEQKLATQLYILLGQAYPDATLPNPDIAGNANAAVALAQIALGNAPTTSSSPTAVGALQAWVLPVVIASALLIGITTAIKSAADVAMQKEQDACIEAGACTDYGMWLKWGAIVGLAWFAWEKLGVGDRVRHHIKGGR